MKYRKPARLLCSIIICMSFLQNCKKENEDSSIDNSPVKEEILFFGTEKIEDITDSSASCSCYGYSTIFYNFQVVSEGKSILEKGLCWSTEQIPTTADNKIIDRSDKNYYTIKITGLNPDSRYYCRAYVACASGTRYGEVLSFRTYYKSRDIVTDVEGNRYHTVIIGTQLWMAENLRTTKYRNGDLIKTTFPDTLNIEMEEQPEYQWAYRGSDSMAAKYGRLYTWYVVSDSRGICPVGWHVPTKEEWQELDYYLENTDGRFPTPKIGCRFFDNTFIYSNLEGYWWSSTENNNYNIWSLKIFDNGLVHANYIRTVKPHQGLSICCIKDDF